MHGKINDKRVASPDNMEIQARLGQKLRILADTGKIPQVAR